MGSFISISERIWLPFRKTFSKEHPLTDTSEHLVEYGFKMSRESVNKDSAFF